MSHKGMGEQCCKRDLHIASFVFRRIQSLQRVMWSVARLSLPLILAILLHVQSSHATISSVSVQSPALSANGTTTLTTPVHFQATAESDNDVTGYVIYVDGQNVFQNYVPLIDAWVVLQPGTTHSLYVKAWDSSGSVFSTPTYEITISGVVTPEPPTNAKRIVEIDGSSAWVVDNNPDVGGQCNDGSIAPFQNAADPNTNNAPDFGSHGQHFTVQSKCQYDDSLFYVSDGKNPSPYAGDTNLLWDFWFYIPATTNPGSIQALENDLFQAVQLSDGVHEFMFGSQCNYASNQWQNWLSQSKGLAWIDVGLTPCQFSTGMWHHATYFLQRVTSSGYQEIPSSFTPSSDTNSYLRFGTITIDGNTMYLGGMSYSTIPNPRWSPTLGVQHQLDSAAAGATIEEYVDKESVTAW
jgi:hypothetical protein